jgi:flagellar motor switch protein FliM
MNLVPGDTIILNKKISTPIDVLANQKPCFYAFPARSSGKYAVVIAPPKKD